MQDEDRAAATFRETKSAADSAEYKTAKYTLGKYEITIKLTSDNKIVDVIEIRISKDFLAKYKDAQPKGYHDVDEFYPEKQK
jgi:hypothetical protein